MVRNTLLLVLLVATTVLAWDNGLGITPQMGWNSWNHFGCNIDETLIRKTALAISNGTLKAAGYEYVNLDDCWQVARNASGYIIEDPKKFPSGMPALINYVHSLGLKFGLYSDAGFTTCAGRPGSLGYEKQDARQYTAWKVDYLKYDNCNDNHTKPEVRYPPMRDALEAAGAKIFFSMCEWGIDDPATWAADIGNSWRTTADIQDNWNSILSNIDENNKWSQYSGPGAWNDPDMLEVGNGGLTDVEEQSHFGLWAISKSPLLVGCDVTALTANAEKVLTNPEVIAINQDRLGVQARKISSNNDLEVWAGPLNGRATVVMLFNRSPNTAQITADFYSVGVYAEKAQVRDLYNRKDLGEFTSNFTGSVVSHGSVLVKVTY